MIKAVIGAGYGDEGKGMMAAFNSTPDTMAVRFNGGAQAGHTVEWDGKRHVFHHFSAASPVTPYTFLSKFFVCHPVALVNEFDTLTDMGLLPQCYIDRRAIITTPYDVFINCIVEEARGHNRHGSVGYGFGETLQRAQSGLIMKLEDNNDLLLKLPDYTRARMETLGFPHLADKVIKIAKEMEEYWIHCREIMKDITCPVGSNFLAKFKDVTFEGAQGLALDQDYGDFPFVTRSNTGLKNILNLCEENRLKLDEVIYASRCYVTKHGAGPMRNELDHLPYEGIIDETNKPSAYQGTLRFAYLDIDELNARIQRDIQTHQFEGLVTKSVSCLDQANGKHIFFKDGAQHTGTEDEFLSLIGNVRYVTHGPAINDVSRIDTPQNGFAP